MQNPSYTLYRWSHLLQINFATTANMYLAYSHENNLKLEEEYKIYVL